VDLFDYFFDYFLRFLSLEELSSFDQAITNTKYRLHYENYLRSAFLSFDVPSVQYGFYRNKELLVEHLTWMNDDECTCDDQGNDDSQRFLVWMLQRYIGFSSFTISDGHMLSVPLSFKRLYMCVKHLNDSFILFKPLESLIISTFITENDSMEELVALVSFVIHGSPRLYNIHLEGNMNFPLLFSSCPRDRLHCITNLKISMQRTKKLYYDPTLTLNIFTELTILCLKDFNFCPPCGFTHVHLPKLKCLHISYSGLSLGGEPSSLHIHVQDSHLLECALAFPCLEELILESCDHLSGEGLQLIFSKWRKLRRIHIDLKHTDIDGCVSVLVTMISSCIGLEELFYRAQSGRLSTMNKTIIDKLFRESHYLRIVHVELNELLYDRVKCIYSYSLSPS
jgi:hypothetical protein